MLIHVGDNDFANQIENEKGIVLVDFWATWCGPCKMIAPVLEQLSSEIPEIKIAKVEVDENPASASKYRITSIPTLMVFKNGTVVETVVGFRPKQELEQIIRKHM
ncbi:thioredoxin [Clostridium polynesiense]|uniref:thioredoxin n=1 Tax=Clostridium polynesiense TaxID=1325933 RepID=UPI000A8E2247|nr:thioredoxin [Clostridium polynesiense]